MPLSVQTSDGSPSIRQWRGESRANSTSLFGANGSGVFPGESIMASIHTVASEPSPHSRSAKYQRNPFFGVKVIE